MSRTSTSTRTIDFRRGTRNQGDGIFLIGEMDLHDEFTLSILPR